MLMWVYEYSIVPGTVYAHTIARQGDTLTAMGDDDPKCTPLPLSRPGFGMQIEESSFLSAKQTAACSASNINCMRGQKRRFEPSS